MTTAMMTTMTTMTISVQCETVIKDIYDDISNLPPENVCERLGKCPKPSPTPTPTPKPKLNPNPADLLDAISSVGRLDGQSDLDLSMIESLIAIMIIVFGRQA